MTRQWMKFSPRPWGWSVAKEARFNRTQHLCGKLEGQTNHAERFFCTLRQRLGRSVRRSSSRLPDRRSLA